jgi:hypothetical protein
MLGRNRRHCVHGLIAGAPHGRPLAAPSFFPDCLDPMPMMRRSPPPGGGRTRG